MNIIGYAEEMLDVACYRRAIRAGLSLAPMGFRTLMSEIAGHVDESEAVDEVREQHGVDLAANGLGADVVHLDADREWSDEAIVPLEEDLPTDEDFSLATDLLAALGLKPGDSSGFEKATGIRLPDGVELIVPQIYAGCYDLPALLWREDDEGDEGLYTPLKFNLLGNDDAGITARCAVVMIFLRTAE